MSASPLTAEALRKTFQAGKRSVTALDGVSFALVPGGGVTGLIGPDGAGKTTLMRLAAGLLVPDSGQITCLGLDATRESLAVQAAVGYMPQRFGLYEDLTVQENLDLYADLQGLPPAERAARYARLAEMTGLGPFVRRLTGRLSGGMKQKLGLACTLVRPPRLLLLDEPTVGVDPVSRRELWEIVYRLVDEEGMAVLLSTAYLDEAERCTDVILLNRGRLVDQGPPADFTAPLRGRTFLVRGNDPSARRALQARLAAQPGVLDAVLQGEAVRVVTEGAAMPDCAALGAGVTCEAVPPRFEDGFVDRLKDPSDFKELPDVTAPRGAGGEAIEVEGLTKRFGDFTAVNALTFVVHSGEIFGLLGANGAGKTTTFRMLCGLLPASAGQLRVAGVDLRHAAAEARGRIGYMSQRFSLYGNLSVRQNLNFFARAYGLRGARVRERLDWALEAFELAEMTDAEAGALPLGYRQRLAMAAALLHEPDILFLDEPTSGVDPLARREFWARINALAEGGVTVLVTTHFMEEAEYCDRLVIMAAGELLATGTPVEVKSRVAGAGEPAPTMEEAFIRLIGRQAAA
ncbi:ABC-type multidrug transport system, ATPase component [Thioflavicoccus mobilis 8321]|uniref:ABC-type multidrug transport system, ATPase component n=1 Tax=Thioflavicoccus mobilis 8321 TaxID=765912 RepID=L0GYI9_9GAMM|nr:ATP-binding cassette domain-containing protein [Thioflavicoccus mobilis]AGA90450.1 ABC-type multidrug transport system, ATPase component [Thioflavicoccus mobilis 8321]